MFNRFEITFLLSAAVLVTTLRLINKQKSLATAVGFLGMAFFFSAVAAHSNDQVAVVCLLIAAVFLVFAIKPLVQVFIPGFKAIFGKW